MKPISYSGALAVFCLALLHSTASFADNNRAKYPKIRPVLPGTVTCPETQRLSTLTGRTDWTDAEIWAWDQICVGKTASFKAWRPAQGSPPTVCPPPRHADSALPIVTSRFIQSVLAYEPPFVTSHSAGGPTRLRSIEETLDLSEHRTKHRLWLDRSRFLKGVEAINFRTLSELSFDGSHFHDSVVLDRSSIGGTLWINNASFFIPDNSTFCQSTPAPCAIQVLAARVGSDFSLTNSKFDGHLNAGGINVAADLHLRRGNYGVVYLNGAYIGGDINTCVDAYDCAEGVELKHLGMDGATIGGSAILNGSVFRGGGFGTDKDVSLDLRAARIGNQLELQNVTLAKNLTGMSVEVEGDALIRGNNVFQNVNFVGARFSGSLDLRGSRFRGPVNLSNAQVRKTLIFHTPSSPYAPPHWQETSSLSLQNAEVNSLQDWGASDNRFIYDTLKGKLDLRNFSYKQFGLIDPARVDSSAIEVTERLTGEERVNRWLALQRHYGKRPLPQPFEQLAWALQRSGYVGEAREVRIASRDQTLQAEATGYSEAALLFAQKIIIGYGYNTWIALIWLALLVLLGTLVGLFGKGLKTVGFAGRAWYSLDAAIPLLELDERHKHFDIEGARAYFYSHRIAGFVLASFLLAGLSGLTK